MANPLIIESRWGILQFDSYEDAQDALASLKDSFKDLAIDARWQQICGYDTPNAYSDDLSMNAIERYSTNYKEAKLYFKATFDKRNREPEWELVCISHFKFNKRLYEANENDFPCGLEIDYTNAHYDAEEYGSEHLIADTDMTVYILDPNDELVPLNKHSQ